jgi:hypothetical protein
MKFYSLDQINQAAQDSEKGDTIKPIVRLSPARAKGHEFIFSEKGSGIPDYDGYGAFLPAYTAFSRDVAA